VRLPRVVAFVVGYGRVQWARKGQLDKSQSFVLHTQSWGGKQHTVCDSGGGTCKIVLTVAQISTVGVELFVVCLDASTGFVECAELH
jgi:hypothetical protein